jgi:polyphosphate kinase
LTATNRDENIKKDISSQKISLDSPSLFLNRELSWIRFNARILEEAQDPWHPLLERVKFLAICGSNLDELFMTRIPRLLKKVNKGSVEKSTDGMTPYDQIEATRREIIPLIKKHVDCWKQELVPALSKEDIYIRKVDELTNEKKHILREFFKNVIFPTLKTAVQDPAHTFIENLRINLLVVAKDAAAHRSYHVLEVPTERFGRLIKIPKHGYSSTSFNETESHASELVFLEDLIENNLDLLFLNQESVSYPFRLTRNAEIDIAMDESSDFLDSVKNSLQSRKTGFASRLEFDKSMPDELRETLANMAGLPSYLLYESDGPLGLVDLWQLLGINRPDLKDKTFLPSISPLLTPDTSLFETIAKRDIILYHPYDSFEVIINLLNESARDQNVLEIYITLYRMDAKSPIVNALMEAAKRGKRVTAIIELKAKFDEENNIKLTWRLTAAGVNTVYNFPNFKVHAKLCLIVRREKGGITRYSHIGSGNYNAVTTKIYGDIGYLTARPEIGAELSDLFNVLMHGFQKEDFKYLLVAPRTLKTEILRRIDREIASHRKSGVSYLAFKLNNLEETDVIKALYKASMAGVKIDLNVRALCCLRPGVEGISDNISVISIVGRFLEHARIYYFRNGGEDEVLIGSSDMMFRNLNERVEVLFSVPDPQIKHAILENILKIHLRDNVKARRLLSDGTYVRVKAEEDEKRINSQSWLIENRGIWHGSTR